MHGPLQRGDAEGGRLFAARARGLGLLARLLHPRVGVGDLLLLAPLVFGLLGLRTWVSRASRSASRVCWISRNLARVCMLLASASVAACAWRLALHTPRSRQMSLMIIIIIKIKRGAASAPNVLVGGRRPEAKDVGARLGVFRRLGPPHGRVMRRRLRGKTR